ncbi:endonuclease/exonuclease/phosphatase family protein [Chryseobacterium populi]|uniref:Putative extracellular nuclease n=1 Tax=Chryseobacterium populi TaxID=1144316 RepID=J3CNL5_9FLAO|nr:endonuclease/exonuclease/phosphatase family protein [Chryseobacterium populi]EJL75096.1 putative extracellular nuclease [Chryseobacterium populi]
MPYYKPLDEIKIAERLHIIENLQKLRQQIKNELPERTNRSSLLLATWNLREFSNSENRLKESFWYIAEIISSFDLIAVQEIGNNMSALTDLMRILGYKYEYIVTDTPNAEGGNERIAFIYNTGKVKFKNIAGEVYLDSKEREKFNLPYGFARPPFMVAFQASWFKFNLCSVHVYYGSEAKNATGEKDNVRRKNEIAALAEKLDFRAKKEDVTYILLGDFNIEKIGDEFYSALVGTKENPTGFYLRPFNESLYTNAKNDRAFDQIAFNMQNLRLEDLDIHEESKNIKMGVLNYYNSVFNNEEYYKPVAEEKYKEKGKEFPPNWKLESWRTFQMSDHLPLWIELKIDFTDQYLETLKKRPDKDQDIKTEIPKE